MSRSSQPRGSTDSAMSTTADQPPARLRVPTSRKAENMWNPGFWSIARPTDFCYGDCVWGLNSDKQPVPLSIIEWEGMILRREELEYDMPGDEEKYEAAAINRFRETWYDIHLLSSFWRVSETTKSIHTL